MHDKLIHGFQCASTGVVSLEFTPQAFGVVWENDLDSTPDPFKMKFVPAVIDMTEAKMRAI